MKQIELELKKRLLIVEVEALELTKLMLSDEFFPDLQKELICKGSELTEDIAEGLVQIDNHTFNTDYYRDYKNDDRDYRNPITSFISAIEAKGYYWGENTEVNPEKYNEALNDDKAWNKIRYSQEKMYLVKIPTYKQQMKLWQEAESKTFNPDKTLIFEILL